MQEGGSGPSPSPGAALARDLQGLAIQEQE